MILEVATIMCDDLWTLNAKVQILNKLEADKAKGTLVSEIMKC